VRVERGFEKGNVQGIVSAKFMYPHTASMLFGFSRHVCERKGGEKFVYQTQQCTHNFVYTKLFFKKKGKRLVMMHVKEMSSRIE